MDAAQLADPSFVLARSDWPVQRIVSLLEAVRPARLVVRDRDTQTYHLIALAEALAALPGAAGVGTALGLDTRGPIPLIDAATDLAEVPAICIVHVDGRVIGFVDAAAARPTKTTRRSGSASPPIAAARALRAELPRDVSAGSEAWLLISLAATPGAESLELGTLPAGAQLDILVQASSGLTLLGDGRGVLNVDDGVEALPLQFKLRAGEPGRGRIVVLAFHQGLALGRIVLSPTIVASGPTSRMLVRDRALAPARSVPDLAMLIEERRIGEETEYTMRLTASDRALGLNLRRYGPIRLRLDPLAYFRDFFAEIEARGAAVDPAAVERRLASKGSNLFQQLFPKDLQTLVWTLRKQISSILIQSEEPWIPWELCRLTGDENGSVVGGPFLCEQFAITRWVPGVGFHDRLSMRNLGLIVPGDSALMMAAQERAYVRSLAGDGRVVHDINPTYLDVYRSLASGRFDALHFAGHGAAGDDDPDRSSIFLEDDDVLRPEDVSGEATNLGKARPLIVFNACQVGRSGMSLTGIGGWARRFVEAGAGAFIGTYWSVHDIPASQFAEEFYSRLIAGVPLGQALLQARLAIRTQGDPTWLAYTALADPLARVET